MMNERDSGVPMAAPAREYDELREEISAAVERVLASGRYVLGETVERFEEAFAARVGVRHAVGVGSGADALELALRAAGIGPGDEVITTPFTFVATATAILATGARPVFADVDPDTFTLHPEAAAAAIGPRTAAMVPVHVFGLMADMGALSAVAERHGLALIEDAAQAFGATIPSEGGPPLRAGACGTLGCFSFYPTKSLGAAGDGGLVTTDDVELAERIRRLGNQGRDPAGVHREPGRTSRLDAIQAAVLAVKLPRVDAWAARRREHAAAYGRALEGRQGVEPPLEPAGYLHTFHQYTVRAEDRAALRRALSDVGIETAVFYDPPLHRADMLGGTRTSAGVEGRAGHRGAELPDAERLAGKVLSIPVFAHLREDERDRVAAVLADAAAGGSRRAGTG